MGVNVAWSTNHSLGVRRSSGISVMKVVTSSHMVSTKTAGSYALYMSGMNSASLSNLARAVFGLFLVW